jgi:hypothetical protein
MTQEALKLALEALEFIPESGSMLGAHAEAKRLEAITAIKEALAQTQEPVAYLCENAVGHKYFRWKKPSSTYKPIALYTTPPQRTERPVDCERCNRLEEQAYDLVGKLRVANIKLSMQPQRAWVGLTDEEENEYNYLGPDMHWVIQEIAAKLKEKNCA